MLTRGEVTVWLRRFKGGAPAPARPWGEASSRRPAAPARKKPRALPRRAADEEDVALSAFDSFCRGAEQGRFPRLDDRGDLWQVLVLITARKAADLRQSERR